MQKCKEEGTADGVYEYIPLDMADKDSPRKLIAVGLIVVADLWRNQEIIHLEWPQIIYSTNNLQMWLQLLTFYHILLQYQTFDQFVQNTKKCFQL